MSRRLPETQEKTYLVAPEVPGLPSIGGGTWSGFRSGTALVHLVLRLGTIAAALANAWPMTGWVQRVGHKNVAEPRIAEPALSEGGGPEVFSHQLMRKMLLPMVLAVLAYGALLLYADAGAITRQAAEVPGKVLVLATNLAVSNYVVRFFRWQYYLRCLQISVPIYDSALIFVSGFAMSITPGKMGEVIKSMLLKQAYDIPVARSAPIVLAERVTDLGGLLILGGVGLLGIAHGTWSAIASFLMVGVLFALSTSRALGTFAINTATRIGPLSRLKSKLLDVQESLLELNKPSAFALGVALSVVAWGVQCVSLSVIASGFADVNLSLQHGLLAYSAPLLAGTLALIPGGLGVTEGSMTGALQSLGGAGATPAVAAAITILCRLTTFWIAIALGFAALAIWRSRRDQGEG